MIERMIRDKKEFGESFSKFISDHSVSLEERWELYCLACDNEIYSNNNSFVIDLKTLESHKKFSSYYETFFIEKYTTVLFYKLVERIESSPNRWTGLDLNALKEEILANRYTGFIFDW